MRRLTLHSRRVCLIERLYVAYLLRAGVTVLVMLIEVGLGREAFTWTKAGGVGLVHGVYAFVCVCVCVCVRVCVCVWSDIACAHGEHRSRRLRPGRLLLSASARTSTSRVRAGRQLQR